MPIISGGSGSAGAVGGLSLIAKQTVGVSGGVLDFTSIPSTFADLVLHAMVRGTAAALQDNPLVRLNGDTGGNYDVQQTNNSAASVGSSETFAATGYKIGQIAAASAGAGLFTHMWVEVIGYANTNWNKVAHVVTDTKLSTSTTGMQQVTGSFFWRSSVAVNEISLAGLNTANLAQFSQGWLYGRGSP